MSLPKSAISPHDPLAVGVSDAARRAGIGRSSLYSAIAAGELTACKIGRRTVIRLSDLAAWLDSLPTVAARAA